MTQSPTPPFLSMPIAFRTSRNGFLDPDLTLLAQIKSTVVDIIISTICLAIEFCELLFRDIFRTKQVPTGAFHVCVMAYVKKMAREIDDVELIYPKSFI
nr:hypothetical transcript [Hymenolepis microstoma]